MSFKWLCTLEFLLSNKLKPKPLRVNWRRSGRGSRQMALISPPFWSVDEGYSGSTLVRPALERLRDVAAAGGIDRLYVHCPDRFARNYASQVLLVEELTQRGVEVIFLNRPLGQTPEDQLLLQVQGVIAEYERAKFLERSRRGKRHAAQEGRVGILCHAPYGYRYIN